MGEVHYLRSAPPQRIVRPENTNTLHVRRAAYCRALNGFNDHLAQVLAKLQNKKVPFVRPLVAAGHDMLEQTSLFMQTLRDEKDETLQAHVKVVFHLVEDVLGYTMLQGPASPKASTMAMDAKVLALYSELVLAAAGPFFS